MDALALLQSLGFEMPTPAYIFGAIVFGLVGLAAFRNGRRTGRRATLWLGVALMVYPYLVSTTWLLYVVGAALCAGIYAEQRRNV
jgi:apolipoprotein N-acyltransferase